MKNSNLFWGILLVTLGALFILKNTGLVYFNWFSVLSLWPLVLVLLGVTLLPIRSFIKTLLSIVILISMIALIFTRTNYWERSFRWKWDHWGDWKIEKYEDDWAKDSENYFYEPYDSEIKEATLTIEAIAGEFCIRNKSDYLMEINQDGNIGPYIFSTRKNGDHQSLILDIKKKHFRVKRLSNDVDIKLNTLPVWNFNINSGAASVDLDLTEFKTNMVDIDGGASSVHIRLGQKYNKTKVSIDSGVSSIKVYIPKDSGCEINTDTFLAAKDFDEFDKIDKGLYQTENFNTAINKIYIDIDAAITSLEVIRY